MKTLFKLNRLSAWILLFTITLYVVTGFGMTKGVISPATSTRWHISYLSYILLISFVYHSAFGIYLAFKRWGIWNSFGKTILFSSVLAFMIFFVYVDVFYSKNKSQDTAIVPKTTQIINDVTTTPQSQDAATRTFTASELAKYDGLNGQPAYVAIDGVVYDMTSLFRVGDHFGYSAGQDLSAAFHAQHNNSLLDGFTVVGRLN